MVGPLAPSSGVLMTDLALQYPIFCRDIYCYSGVGPGWEKLVDQLCKEVEPLAVLHNLAEAPQLAQYKEKYGYLTIYIDNCTEEIGLIRKRICHVADATCENCGHITTAEHPVTRKGHWIQNLCQKCHGTR